MGNNKILKISKIEVEEILNFEKKLLFDDTIIVVAKKELIAYVKEKGSKDALTLKGFALYLRTLSSPPITPTLAMFIKSKSNWRLKRIISDMIIASHGGTYSSFQLEEGWKRTKGRVFWYYYFTDKFFLNIYSIKNDDLPLYINYEFKDDDDKNLYIKRLQLANIPKEKR